MPRTVYLTVVSTFAPGPKALAWCGLDSGKVVVRWPFHRIFFSDARLAHELDHVRTGIGNEGHHPPDHFCIRSPWALRFLWDHTEVTRELARKLRREKTVVL